MTDQTRVACALADRYRLERELGAGGMATVYLAQDLKHDRMVAIKVLRPELAAVIGAERFLSEIKTTANLQHPHILPLFDSGSARVPPLPDGERGIGGEAFLFYVMPFIDGESLRDRLTREKQLPITDAVRIATEVASALDYAHRHNVIHRDIKPENILLHDGRALVADFGIALAASKAGGGRMTETGMSLGTPTYMSPEQAMGEREITARSDVYALGAMTYEMLTGDPPFTGSSAQAIVAKVMTDEPAPLRRHRKAVTPPVEDAVLTALEKLPADRFGSAAEFAAALNDPGYHSTARTVLTTAVIRNRYSALLGILLGIATALAAWGWLRGTGAAHDPVRRYAIEMTGLEAIAPRGESSTLAITRDGRRLAYIGGSADGSTQIWIRDRDQLHAHPLSGTSRATSLSWSPDGHRVAFLAPPGVLKWIAADGGPPVRIADSLVAGGGTAWARDGMLYTTSDYGGMNGLVRVSVTGGTPTAFTTVDTASHAFAHLNPSLLPNNRGLLFTIWYGPTRPLDNDIAVADLKTGQYRILMHGARARYLTTGHLLVARSDGSLAVVPFNQDRMVTTGPEVPVITGVAVAPGANADFDVSDSGTLVYYAGEPLNIREMVQPVWVTRDGRTASIDSSWSFERPFNGGLSLAPDGRRLAVAIAGDRSADIWVKQLDHGPLIRITFEEFLKYRPTWTPDGRNVTYLSDPGNNNASIYQRRADGTGAAERLLASERSLAEATWSHDGRWLVVRTTIPSRDILGFHPGLDTVLVPLVAAAHNEERAATLSPDGQWIAYQSDESGRDEIYVRPFPKTENGRWQITTDGGEEPLWSHSGREIFFRARSGEMMTVPITTTGTLSSGAPRVLFQARAYSRALSYRAYDVTPDDQRFVMLRPVSDSVTSPTSQMIVVDNWYQELRQKMARP